MTQKIKAEEITIRCEWQDEEYRLTLNNSLSGMKSTGRVKESGRLRNEARQIEETINKEYIR